MPGILRDKKGTSSSGILREKESEQGTKPSRFYSNQQEKAVAKATNGKQTANSGATLFQKGDVLTEDWLIECKTKTTHADSISIKKEWFEKNLKEASMMNKEYTAIVFNFGPGEENHYIIDEVIFQEMLVYLNNIKHED